MRRSDSGFSAAELLVVIALIAVGSGMVAMTTSSVIKLGKADSGIRQVAGILRKAREEAIEKRRNVKVKFDLANSTIEIDRVEYNWAAAPPTPVDTFEQLVRLEGGVTFLKDASIGNTYPISTFPKTADAVSFTK